MTKKFLSTISLFVFTLIAGICLVACGGPKTVSVKGTVSVQFDDFTSDDVDNYMYFSCTAPATTNEERSATGSKFTYGPADITNPSDVTLTINLSRKWDTSSINVTEKDNKPFTKKLEDDGVNSYRYILLTIPYSEDIDYTFVITKPTAQINYVNLDLSSSDASVLDSTDTEIRDLLDHTEVWVENKEYDPNTNVYTAGWAPLVVTQNESHQLGIAGKYIFANLTRDTFTLYLKYDNDGRDLPFNSTIRSVFSLTNYSSPNISTATLNGQKVYALEYDTEDLDDFDTIYLNKSGLESLQYLSASVTDKNEIVTDMDAYTNSSFGFKFSLEGWKLDDQVDWQTDGQVRKDYGQKLTLKYKYNGLDNCPFQQDEKILQITDFAKIKFQVNGSPAKNLQYNASDKTYTFEIGEYDTPETYSGEYSNHYTFDISVDPYSITIVDSETNVKDITFTTGLEFFNQNNTLFSRLDDANNLTHAYTYFNNTDPNATHEVVFFINDISRYESFTLDITLNGTNYTKTFVRGTDFIVKQDGTGAFAGTYLFDSPDTKHYLLGTESLAKNETKIYYFLSENTDTRSTPVTSLLLYIDSTETNSRTNMQVLLKDVTYRNIRFEVSGTNYAGSVNAYDVAWSSDTEYGEKNVTFAINDINNLNITAKIYSGDVCIIDGPYNASTISFDLTSQIAGYTIGGMTIYYNYGNNDTVYLKVGNNGYIRAKADGTDTFVCLLITKIVFTFN